MKTLADLIIFNDHHFTINHATSGEEVMRGHIVGGQVYVYGYTKDQFGDRLSYLIDDVPAATGQRRSDGLRYATERSVTDALEGLPSVIKKAGLNV